MIKFILMDVEGTTTAIRFVKDRLFPYAYEKMDDFIHNNFAQICEAGENLGVATPGELADIYKNWIKEDKKEPQLKALQGKIWKKGYANRELKGHVYPDVLPAWKKWKDLGTELAIYSSGSVEAQKLLYSHSEQGDLSSMLSAHFDLGVGKKFERQSYERISSALGAPPQDILFLSDVEKELEAARDAGLKTVRVFRDELEESAHPFVKTFAQIDLNQLSNQS